MSSEMKSDTVSLFAAAGIGAALMYLLDPARGKRRRHLVADKLIHATHVTGETLATTGRDLRNHALGLGASARELFRKDEADDVVIAERVRAELGRVVAHPSSIDVSVTDGQVILSGPVLTHEMDDLLSAVQGIRGVAGVEDHLERHERPGNVPGLQGAAQPSFRKFELLQENWTPAARFLTTVSGAALATYALQRRDRQNPFTALLGLAGLALAARGGTNMPFRRMVGVGAGRRAVTLQKNITIAAPIDEAFAWLTEWERWPEWMTHVREVTATGERGAEGERTHWVVDGPAGTTISWDAVTTRIVPPELVAWKTVEGSPIAHTGRLLFIPNEDGTTRVDLHISYNPIAGAAGHAVAALFGRDPKRQLNDDLARLKTVMDTGRAPHDAARAST